ncbi:DNA topoisomerase VI subunit B [Candidatus Woesearchaeota archaeon]|nr:DNA topoisomerase VI subunit B [Candidatus Woesearchaeota archaeon]
MAETQQELAAYELAKKQREISIAEFFEKNRHLLGFDNKRKALLTAVKEAVDNSVEYHEPVLVKDKGLIKVVKIGEYIDRKLKESEITEREDAQSAKISGVETLVYDSKTLKLGFKAVSSVHRHPLRDKLYEITIVGNRKVKLTGSHSIFALKQGRVTPYKVSELKEGDFVVVPRKQFRNPDPVRFLDIRDWAKNLPAELRERLVIKGVSSTLTNIPRDWKRFDYVPLSYFTDNHLALPESARIGVKLGRSSIPVRITITHELMRLLGYYAAEGTCYDQCITLSFGAHEEALMQDAEKCIKDTFPNANFTRILAHRTAITIKIHSEILSCLFKGLGTGSRANTKKVPTIVFNAESDMQSSFLQGYISGDGHVGSKITMATVSKDLSTGLKYLFSMQGIPFSESVREETVRDFGKYISKCKKVYYIYVYPSSGRRNSPLNWLPLEESGFRQIIKSLDPKIGTLNPHYRMISRPTFTFESANADLRLAQSNRRGQITEALQQRIEHTEKLLAGEIGFLQVRTVKEATSSREHVYDFSVPGEEKFLGGEGVIFLHNSLDACEEARILPEVKVEIIEMSEERYRVIVEDNGPGIVKEQIPKVFAKLLYGSKFHHLQQKRGQQGIGISAAVLYSQLTTGKPAKITSRIGKNQPASYYELNIDIKANKPEIVKQSTTDWAKEQGTIVELELQATYQKGLQSVDEYLKQTAIINPHITIIYTTPKAEQIIYARSTEELPPEPKEIKPHPYGVELGLLIRMLDNTESRTLQSFLTSEFSRVGPETAKEICHNSSLLPSTKPQEISRQQAEQLMNGIASTKLIAPSTDCLSPISEQLIEKGLRSVINAEFYCSTARPPAVYRGNPFVISAGVAYGGQVPEGAVTLLRFANRVPLLYQQGACVITDAIGKTNWKQYGLSQSQGAVPAGPAVILVHMASVWVPFTSEAKEALAHYPEIIKEIKLALQECGRKLGLYINKKKKATRQLERANLFETYIPEIADSLATITGQSKEELLAKLKTMLNKPEIEAQIEKQENPQFDEKMKLELGKEEENEE